MRDAKKGMIILILVFFGLGCTNGVIEKNKEDNIEEKVYNWIKGLQNENGLLESSEDSNFVSLYDNSLAALVFIENKDFNRAEKIFDFFESKRESEFLNGEGGFGQFRDKYGFPKEGNPHRWMGDNAWLLIALNNYHYYTNSKKYIEMSSDIEEWLRSLQDTDGGLWGGTDQSGEKIPKITEGIIDSYNAVKGYDNFHKDILNFLKNNRWDKKEELFMAWPENQKYKFALDLHPWGYCIFEDFPVKVLDDANRYKTTKDAAFNSEEVVGYCFDEDIDTIWLEGTGEMAVAYNTAKKYNESDKLISEIEKVFIGSNNIYDAGGMPYVTNIGTTYGSDTIWDGADINPCISASAWYLFSKRKFDPFIIEKDKGMPESDKFWEN